MVLKKNFQIYRPFITTTVKTMKCCPLKKDVLVYLVTIVPMEMIEDGYRMYTLKAYHFVIKDFYTLIAAFGS